jgi:hypothetical protein
LAVSDRVLERIVRQILAFNESGSVLAVRPHVHNDNYWQVPGSSRFLTRGSRVDASDVDDGSRSLAVRFAGLADEADD